METIVTNEWYDARLRKPLAKRQVLVRMSDGRLLVASWNGFYWVEQDGCRLAETVGCCVERFYVYERDVE